MSFFTGKKLLLIGFLAVLLAVIPITVFFLGKQTQTGVGATPATTLYFATTGGTTPLTTLTKNVGDSVDLDIIMNPGSNQVIASTIYITYDPTKLQIADNGLKPSLIQSASQSQGFSSILSGPTYGTGNASVTLTVGVDFTTAIKTTQKVASISFDKVLAGPTTNISFGDNTKSNVTSAADTEINVLLPPQPLVLTIGQSGNVGIGNSAPTATPIPVPVCTGLTVDRATTGPAPFSITFTANGNDPTNGTISKVTFDFGDGPTQDVAATGGIGTKSVNVQLSHRYDNPGTYNAKSILTNNNNGVSAISDACSQTITVTAATGGMVATPAPIVVTETPTEIITPSPLPQKNLNPGPGDTFFTAGIFGIGLSILGAIIFVAL